MRLSIIEDVLRGRGIQTGNMLQQLCRSRIDIDAHTVDRLGHDEVQSFFEPCRRQIMLILPDPDR